MPKLERVFDAVDELASILDAMAAALSFCQHPTYTQIAEDARASLAHAYLFYEGDWSLAENEVTQASVETEAQGPLWDEEQLQTDLELLWGRFVFQALARFFQ